MAGFWQRGSDNLKNGTVLGALMGAGIAFGEKITDYLSGIIPSKWLYLGDWSITVYLIVALALVGYFIDRH